MRLIPLFFATWLLLSAEDLYLAQSAAGSGNGSNCANALAYTFFNSSGNWGSGAGKISSGDTVHICGTITGSGANTTAFSFQSDGVSGSPITLLFEANAKLSNAVWGSALGAIYGGASRAWVIVDGGTNGIIENTDNGSSPTYSNHLDSGGVYFPVANNVIIRNLTVSNMYVRNSASDESSGGDSIDIHGGQGNRITNNIVHDAKNCITYTLTGTQSGIEIDHNTLYHCNWGTVVGTVTDVTVTGFSFHDNELYDWQNWDDPPPGSNQYHHNGIHMYLEGGTGASVVSSPLFYNNYFHGDPGGYMTAMIYLESNSGDINNARVFNNVMNVTSVNAPTNGFSNAKGTPTATAYYNNTLIYSANIGGLCMMLQGVSGAVYKNNVFQNCGQVFYVSAGTMGSADYNDFVGMTTIDGSATTIAAWRSSSGQDAHGISSAPSLDGAFHPLTGSPLRNVGANLTNLGITALNSDKANTARPGGSTAWDIGAYQFGAASPTIIPSSFPTGTVSQFYSQLLTPGGFSGTITWTRTVGALPPGLSDCTGTGATKTLSGTLTTAGAYSWTCHATDGTNSADDAITMTVNAAGGPLTITNPTSCPLPAGIANNAYSLQFVSSGGTAPINWSKTGTLPAGMTFTSGGLLSGTPTASGPQTLTYTATDSLAATASLSACVITINTAGAAPHVSVSSSQTYKGQQVIR